MKRPSLWADEKYQTNAGRVAHRNELVPILQDLFRTRPTAEWINLLVETGIPVGPINDIPTILNDPQITARKMVQEVEHRTTGTIKLLGPVAKLSKTPAQIHDAPPPLGADTEFVLRQHLNYSSEQIARLREEGVV